MSSSDSLIDTSREVPHIEGTRITLVDVMAAIDGEIDTQEAFDYWEVPEKHREAALEYVEAHREELEALIQET